MRIDCRPPLEHGRFPFLGLPLVLAVPRPGVPLFAMAGKGDDEWAVRRELTGKNQIPKYLSYYLLLKSSYFETFITILYLLNTNVLDKIEKV